MQLLRLRGGGAAGGRWCVAAPGRETLVREEMPGFDKKQLISSRGGHVQRGGARTWVRGSSSSLLGAAQGGGEEDSRDGVRGELEGLSDGRSGLGQPAAQLVVRRGLGEE